MTTITIDMDKPCQRCGKKGSAPNGLCLTCILKSLKVSLKVRPARRRDHA